MSCIGAVFQSYGLNSIAIFALTTAPHLSTYDYVTSPCTWLNLPGLPPPFLHTVSNKKKTLTVAIAWKGSFLIEKGKLGSMICSLPYAHTVHIVEDKCLCYLHLKVKNWNLKQRNV